MLTHDDTSEDLVERYANFLSTLTWYRMYCVGEMGKSKADYIKGFSSIKNAYDHLFEIGDEGFPKWGKEPLSKMFDSIQTILNTKKLDTIHIQKIGKIIWNFQEEDEAKFQKQYVEFQVHEYMMFDYPKELHKIVHDLIKQEKNDEAVITAFKYLDAHLQKLLNVSPHEYYGEELVNYAFSPNSGKLQLQTHLNEQVGLRNFFSGANALFRNPSAHRFMKYDIFTAGSIVAMITIMANIATNLAKKNTNPSPE